MTNQKSTDSSQEITVQPGDEAHTIDLMDTLGKIMVCIELSEDDVEKMDEQPHPLDKKGYVMGKPVKVRR